jgi:hypothetical protein
MRIWGFCHHLMCHLVPMITRLVAPLLFLRLLLQRLTLRWMLYFSLSLNSRLTWQQSRPDRQPSSSRCSSGCCPCSRPFRTTRTPFNNSSWQTEQSIGHSWLISFSTPVFLFLQCSLLCLLLFRLPFAIYSVKTSATLFWSSISPLRRSPCTSLPRSSDQSCLATTASSVCCRHSCHVYLCDCSSSSRSSTAASIRVSTSLYRRYWIRDWLQHLAHVCAASSTSTWCACSSSFFL